MEFRLLLGIRSLVSGIFVEMVLITIVVILCFGTDEDLLLFICLLSGDRTFFRSESRDPLCRFDRFFL